jgi:Activator of Hsp90 ATPase homolog 1-like protein
VHICRTISGKRPKGRRTVPQEPGFPAVWQFSRQDFFELESKVTFDIEAYHEIVRLTVTHENLADDEALQAISAGWPAVFANLKSLLETGHVLPRAPWEMHAGLRAAQMARNDPDPRAG